MTLEVDPEDQEGAADKVSSDGLMLDIEGFEGPLDLLLTLARTQKVDLMQVSILELAEQYLTFIEGARKLRLEIAADYLVAAAWLAYLKSRLLLPVETDDGEPNAEEMAALLAHRLQRLEAMRKVAAQLLARDRMGRDRFVRGAPDPIDIHRKVEWTSTILDLLQAYARSQSRVAYTPLHFERPKIYAMEDALARLNKSMGVVLEWTQLEQFLPDDLDDDPMMVRSAVASTFAAALELARDGVLAIEQTENFGPIRLRQGERTET